jgi:hypothetical protein
MRRSPGNIADAQPWHLLNRKEPISGAIGEGPPPESPVVAHADRSRQANNTSLTAAAHKPLAHGFDRRREDVSDATLGADQPRAALGLDLPSQPSDLHVHSALIRFVVVETRKLKQLLA